MLYIGHFDFLEDESENGPRHGYFTCVAEADNIEAALEKFRALLLSLRKEGDLFDGLSEVFLDSCVEVSSIPEAGFLAHYVSILGERRASISTSVCGASQDQCSAYAFGAPEEDEEEEGECQVEPFITFEEGSE